MPAFGRVQSIEAFFFKTLAYFIIVLRLLLTCTEKAIKKECRIEEISYIKVLNENTVITLTSTIGGKNLITMAIT